jgi:uncharacterized protein DUF6194
MTESEIVGFVTEAFEGVDVVVASADNGAPEAAWGDTFFSYGDARFPFATIVIHDYEGFDTESNLDRPGVFRVNASVSKETFDGLFGGGDDGDDHDFTALDTPLPHPIYGAQAWVSVLNPGPATDGLIKTLLAEAYERAVARHERRTSR